MTFKLRSGNKTPFKMMGSSPMKQASYANLDETDAKRIKETTRQTKEKQLEDEIAYKELQDEQLRQTLEDAPWSDTRKKENISMKDGETVSATGEGGYDYNQSAMSDANINKYKSKQQIKQDSKDRKLDSKISGNEYTKDEKYADKQLKRQDKYQRARGTGEMGLRFNWKNALLGDGLMAGFSVDKKENIIGDKIKKAAEKRRDKQLKDKRKATRKTKKAAHKEKVKNYRKAYKEYKKGIKGKNMSPISFEDYMADKERQDNK